METHAGGHTFTDANILVIDDNDQNVKLILRVLNWGGYTNVKVITDSRLGLNACLNGNPDIVLLDLQMPAPDGYEILAKIRQSAPQTGYIPVLIFTADSSAETRKRALDAGATDFLTKPGDPSEILLRVRNFLQTRKFQKELMERAAVLEEAVKERTVALTTARCEALRTLARVSEARDDDTGEHTIRVGELSAEIARQYGESPVFVESILRAAPLHDIGKVAIKDIILLKPARLNAAEMETMRRHTLIGASMLAGAESPLMKMAYQIALSHHEKWDGSGYPQGLKGDQIPLPARIVAVADVYDALTHDRPYKEAWSHSDALAEIIKESGTQFDPKVVEAFVTVVKLNVKRAA